MINFNIIFVILNKMTNIKIMIDTTLIPTTSGIYKFTNTVNNKFYIGSAQNLRRRFFKHTNLLNKNSHHSLHFQNAWNKYGEDVFIYEVIEYCDEKDLLLREQYYLDTLLFAQDYINSKNSNFLELGYNVNPCATSRLGSKQSKNSIEKAIMNNPKRIEVLQFDFHGNFIKEYISVAEAAFEIGCSKSNVLQCCMMKQEYCKQYFCYSKKYFENNSYLQEYMYSLKDNPFVPQVWNKGKKFKANANNCKKVLVFTCYGEFIKEFESQKLAAEFITATEDNIRKAKNKKIVKNYYVFDKDFDYSSIINEEKSKYDKICIPHFGTKFKMFNIFGTEISSWNSIKECETLTNLSYAGINSVLAKRRKQYLNFTFKYYDDIV